MAAFKFDKPAPRKFEVIKIEEWDADEEFTIHELSGNGAKFILDMLKKAQENKSVDDLQFEAEIVNRCLTNSEGEHPPIEWLLEAGVSRLKDLTNQCLRINGVILQEQEKAEKN